MALKKAEKVIAKKPARARSAARTRRGTTRESSSPATESRANVSAMPYAEALIRERAYYIYVERGGAAGDPVADWFQAERELNDPVGHAER